MGSVALGLGCLLSNDWTGPGCGTNNWAQRSGPECLAPALLAAAERLRQEVRLLREMGRVRCRRCRGQVRAEGHSGPAAKESALEYLRRGTFHC